VETPRPGDLVEVEETDDTLIKRRSYGVIISVKGECKGKVEVVFNFYTPYDDSEIVNASGGPSRIISIKRLKPTNKTVELTFWRFKDNYPAQDNATYFKRKVRVFKVNLQSISKSK